MELNTGALYTKISHNGAKAHQLDHIARGARFGMLPSVIQQHCDHSACGKVTNWAVNDGKVYFAHLFYGREYVCNNCGRSIARFWFLWTESPGDYHSTFAKVGQYPALSIEPLPELAKSLGREDTLLYKKALVNANYSYGLGALAYLRRVIENKVNLLLDLISDAAKLANFEGDELTRLEEIKTSHHLDVKIEYASKILPPHLKPGGHNPLNRLYSVASSGIHGKSDEQCLEDFQNARFEFEYLFKNLTVNNEEAREFVKRVSSPRT